MGTLDFIIRMLGILSFIYLIYGTWETAKSEDLIGRNMLIKKIESSIFNVIKYFYIKIQSVFK